MSQPHLDDAVLPAVRALREAGGVEPEALFLMSTGLGPLPSELEGLTTTDLGDLPGAPPAWQEGLLHAGRLGTLRAWLLEDAPGGYETGEAGEPGRPAWERAWPVWLAAASGAELCVHTSAGVLLGPRNQPGLELGGLAVLTDHLNLSGGTPLLGLGESRLGPLFPDQSRVHHHGLRARLLAHARRLGVPCGEGLAACLVGPGLATPAELAWLSQGPASVAVQGLADPLIAAAHAGLAVVALVALTDSGDEPLRMAELVDRAEAAAPGLFELLNELAPDLHAAAGELALEA